MAKENLHEAEGGIVVRVPKWYQKCSRSGVEKPPAQPEKLVPLKIRIQAGCASSKREEISIELNQLKLETINREHLTKILAQFGPLWEVLTLTDRMRLVNLVVESAVNDPKSGEVRLGFRPFVLL